MPIGNGLSGITANTPYNLILDAGVFYKNINLTELRAGGSDAWANAINPLNTWTDPNGTIVTPTPLGATRGGAKVKLNRDERQVDVDSKRTNIKGFDRINMIDPQISISLLEAGVTDVIQMALGTSERTDWNGWAEIVPQLLVQDTDYIANVALFATISGEDQPMIIVLSNARVVEVGDMTFQDKNEAVFDVTFRGHSLPTDPLTIPISYFCPSEYDGSVYNG